MHSVQQANFGAGIVLFVAIIAEAGAVIEALNFAPRSQLDT